MPLESGTYISDLNASNPLGTGDPKAQGDDHLRLIKATLKNSFPTINGAVTATLAQINALDGGTLAAANGSNLTALNASALASGTVADARLSGNVPLLSAENSFTRSESGTSRQFFENSSTNSACASDLRITGGTTDVFIGATHATNVTPVWTNGPATGHGYIGTNVGQLSIGGGGVEGIRLASTAVTLKGTTIALVPGAGFANVQGTFRVWDGTNAGIELGSESSTAVYVQSYDRDSSVFTDLHFYAAAYAFKNTSSVDTLVMSDAGNFDFKDGTVTTAKASASEVGTVGVPLVSKTADYTLAAVDGGTELVLTSAADDITVQASGQPVAGMVVFLKNLTGGSVDIIQGSGMTLTLDGTATTGSRTLAANGRAYVRFTGSGTADVGGIGVA
jgi:hypothetical protein